jgi:hypothetical protein
MWTGSSKTPGDAAGVMAAGYRQSLTLYCEGSRRRLSGNVQRG